MVTPNGLISNYRVHLVNGRKVVGDGIAAFLVFDQVGLIEIDIGKGR